jgi:hypothetical protein
MADQSSSVQKTDFCPVELFQELLGQSLPFLTDTHLLAKNISYEASIPRTCLVPLLITPHSLYLVFTGSLLGLYSIFEIS